MVTVHDVNREDGIKQVDIGNYFKDYDGARCVITTKEFAIKYGHLVDVPIYIRKTLDRNTGQNNSAPTLLIKESQLNDKESI